ncbi:MAG: nucleotidyltransferase domain-containing protein [Nanoarchaeota archaeon]|nr:nucleotidyltransferase domain-containing protein [Nanoarchaeota archaeon]MBU1975296.1 nucleotidyltransferase domain-containing protein [Nanoarchaeota archaeon]
MKPEDKVYLAYFEAKKPELYFNEIKGLTELSDSSLANTLKRLVLEKILSVNKTKSNTYYQVRNKKLIALKFAEIALRKFNNLNRGVKIPLHNFLEKTSQNHYLVILFGSASRKEEKKGSDIDILIIADKKQDFGAIKKEVDALSNYNLNIFTCSRYAFLNNSDHIIIQAKKTGFPIKGEQNFYEVLINENF